METKASWRSFIQKPDPKIDNSLEVLNEVSDEEGCINLSDDEIEMGSEHWKFALVGYVVGERISFVNMSKYVLARWKDAEQPEILSHNSGCFIFNFETENGMQGILNKPVQFVFGKPLVLRRWSPDFSFDIEDLQRLPVWVQLPNLNLKYWSKPVLSKIGSYIRKLVQADPNTVAKMRIPYARLLIEVETSGNLVESIKLKDSKGVVEEQDVRYEWIPQVCACCHKWGHKTEKCKAKEDEKKKEIRNDYGENQNVAKISRQQEKEDKSEWTEVRRRRKVGMSSGEEYNQTTESYEATTGRNSKEKEGASDGGEKIEGTIFIPT